MNEVHNVSAKWGRNLPIYLFTRLHFSVLKLLNGLGVNLVLNDHIKCAVSLILIRVRQYTSYSTHILNRIS
jgi:hypothetical protein